jgi:N4-gp56 family major capsid protein
MKNRQLNHIYPEKRRSTMHPKMTQFLRTIILFPLSIMMGNFTSLSVSEKSTWSRLLWKAARNNSFIINKFCGTDQNNVVQRITELTKTERGDRCIMTLVADLVEDGGVGDARREGMEESMKSYEIDVVVDLMNHGVISEGKLAEQKSIVKFRETAMDKLGYWLPDRIDQMAFLTMSGISYAFKNDGSARLNSNLPKLAFASHVTAPSSKRYRRWSAAQKALVAGDTTAVDASDVPTYEMLTSMGAYAKDHYIKPLMAGGKEYYILFVKPGTLKRLKNDPDYKAAVITALPRDLNNPFFTGATVTIDGLVIQEHRYVYSTNGAAIKWGDGTVNGTRTLLCGAQALGLADLGNPDWVEKNFQYDSQPGINIDKMLGLTKPQFFSIYDNSTEDFGILAVDHMLDQY